MVTSDSTLFKLQLALRLASGCTYIPRTSITNHLAQLTPTSILVGLLLQLVLWVSISSWVTPPFPAPSLWVRGRVHALGHAVLPCSTPFCLILFTLVLTWPIVRRRLLFVPVIVLDSAIVLLLLLLSCGFLGYYHYCLALSVAQTIVLSFSATDGT